MPEPSRAEHSLSVSRPVPSDGSARVRVKMTGNYDVEHLIALVRKRPVLWNKTLDTYKDKLLTKKAWQDICCELDGDFELKTEEEKQDYGKFLPLPTLAPSYLHVETKYLTSRFVCYSARDVMKKWWNVRDNYVKICKKMAISPVPVKKYVYHNLLQFLPINGKRFKKEFATTSTDAKIIPIEPNVKTEEIEACHSDHSGDDSFKRPQSFTARKRKFTPPPMSSKKYELVVQPEDRHISFFRGIMPSLDSFDDDDVIQFQMGVLQLIADIKSHRRMNQISQQASSSTFNEIDDDSLVKMEYLG